MPLLFNYWKKTSLFYGLECQFRKKLNIKCKEFQLTWQMIAMDINVTITMTYLQLETRIMYYRNFSSQIFCRQRKTPIVIRQLLSSPRHPILHSNIFFYVTLFATVILSWNSLKYILWYLLELSDPFIKNENSVSPILMGEKLNKKFIFVSWKWGQFFFEEGKSNFFD